MLSMSTPRGTGFHFLDKIEPGKMLHSISGESHWRCRGADKMHGLMLKGVVENHHFVRLPASFAKESFKAASPIMNLPENRAHFKRIIIISRNWGTTMSDPYGLVIAMANVLKPVVIPGCQKVFGSRNGCFLKVMGVPQ